MNFYSNGKAVSFYIPPSLKQTLLVMKLICCFLFTIIFSARAMTTYSQVTIKATNMPLEQVLKDIRKQSGYVFFYDGKDISGIQVNLNVQNATIEIALDACLKNQPITYGIEDKTVFLKKKLMPHTLKNGASTPPTTANITVSGRVIDENNQPLAGATVSIKNSNLSTITDRNGIFSLKGVDLNATITISFIGYDKYELQATPDFLGEIKLKPASNGLDEVKVIAYGKTTERLNVGNINAISAKTIEEQPVSDPILTLEGRIPGLIIQQQTGFSVSAVKVQIQGVNSVNAGADPLYVIDGVPYDGQMLPNIATNVGLTGTGNASLFGGGSTISPFSFLSPNDIESISVLKDASATSIYGSRAANGAILITTKKGRPGRTQINFNVQEGFGKDAEMPKLLNTQQYLQLRHWALADDKLTPGPFDYDVNGQWDTTRYTNWEKVLLGGTAKFEDYSGSISGGDNNITYLIGGTYHRETTVFPGDFSDNKGSFHFSLNGSSDNNKFKYQFSGSYLADRNVLPQNDFTYYAVTTAPDAPALYNPDGSINWLQNSSGTSTWGFVAPALNEHYINSVNNLTSNSFLSYEVAKNLIIRSSFGYNILQQKELQTAPLNLIAPEVRAYTSNAAVYSNNNQHNWIVEPQISYDKSFGGGKLSVLAGATVQREDGDGQIITGVNYPNDQLLSNVNNAGTIYKNSGTSFEYKYSAIFGRLGYNWKDKYLVEVSARRDGSSRFGENNLYQNFASVGLGWIFSEEKLIKDTFPLLNYGKLSTSYGSTGNDQIGNYNFLSAYGVSTPSVPYQGVGSLTPTVISNPNLQWELDKKFNAKIDLGFFNNRISASIDYYRNRSSNLLLSYALPVTTGFKNTYLNLPAVTQNAGWEFTLTTFNIKSDYFSWRSSVNLTIPVDNQKLISFPGLDVSSYAGVWNIGKPILVPATKYYQSLGIDPNTGYYLFSDGKGGTTTSPDYASAANVIPNFNRKFYGAIDNTFTYKRFSLQFIFQFDKQQGTDPLFFQQLGAGHFDTNVSTSFLNGWHSPGGNERYPKLTTGADFGAFLNVLSAETSTANIVDDSYIKLKNLSFNWQVPDEWIKKTGINSARIFVQGQNLLTITHYLKGVDPETQSITTLPPLRIIAFGLNVGF